MTDAEGGDRGRDPQPGPSCQEDDVDIRWMEAIVSRNAEVEETRLGAAMLDLPARGIAWPANRLHQYDAKIEAGQVVPTGSFIRPV